MDQEIEFASEAGLDYWAFLVYPKSSTMKAAGFRPPGERADDRTDRGWMPLEIF